MCEEFHNEFHIGHDMKSLYSRIQNWEFLFMLNLELHIPRFTLKDIIYLKYVY